MNFGRSLAEGMQKNLFHFLARCKVITFAQNNAMAKSGAFESIFFKITGLSETRLTMIQIELKSSLMPCRRTRLI